VSEHSLNKRLRKEMCDPPPVGLSRGVGRLTTLSTMTGLPSVCSGHDVDDCVRE
jgi:hypothetical protein